MIITDAEIIGPWVAEKCGYQWIPGRSSTFGKISDGRIVAGVAYEDFNGANVNCHICFEPNSLTREFLGLIYQYPFFQLGVKRITGLVVSTNQEALKLDMKMGFEVENVMKDAHPDGDIIVLVMWKNKCRYLDDKYGKNFVKYR